MNQLERKPSTVQPFVEYEDGSLERRLAQLKHAFQAELITQEEYQRKRQEIVDQF